MELTPEQKAAAEKERANEKLLSLREETFEWGEANQAQFFSMKTHMTTLGHDMHETEWVLWQGLPVHDLADAGRHRPGAGCHVPEEAPGRAEGQDPGAVVGRTASRHRGRGPECLSRHAGRLAFLTLSMRAAAGRLSFNFRARNRADAPDGPNETETPYPASL
jgi:hypothetical protein